MDLIPLVNANIVQIRIVINALLTIQFVQNVQVLLGLIQIQDNVESVGIRIYVQIVQF